jgi:(S)-ureidoglycine aminohydrolase
MHPTDLPGQPGVVPPGAIGHNRGVVGRNFAFIPPEGVLKSRLPAWKSATVRFLAAPALGAGFAQYMLEIEPAGGTAQPICVDLQHFFYVVAGGVDVTVGSDPPVELAVGAFVYVPPGVSFTMSCHPTAPARIIAVKKRYEKAEGIAAPTAIIGQQQAMPMTNHTGLQGRGFKHLLPMGDLRFDFEMNLMFFQPGVCFPAVETHIMEHGLFMLEGQGLYYLDNSWHEIWVDDFIWMGSFCPQQFYPTGLNHSVYLLYKNVNRDVVL